MQECAAVGSHTFSCLLCGPAEKFLFSIDSLDVDEATQRVSRRLS